MQQVGEEGYKMHSWLSSSGDPLVTMKMTVLYAQTVLKK